MVTSVPDISIVMPCYNEEEAVPVVIPRTLRILNQLKKEQKINEFELIVVNDQSTDRTLEMLSKYESIKLIHTVGSRGYGKALKTGFEQARGEWIGFFDVDSTYRPEDLHSFIHEISRGQSDFIMGSRSLDEKGMSLTRGFGNWFYVFLAKVLYGSKLSDVCSGYRMFHRKYLADILSIEEQGLDFSIYLTLSMILKKVFIQQIPIQYDPRIGESKLSIYSDGLAFLKVLLTIRARRLSAFKHRRVW